MPSPHIQTHLSSADVWVVSLSGEHDLTTVQELDDALLLVPEQAHLIVDLTRAEFIDSTTLAAMMRAGFRDGSRPTPISVALAPGSPPERLFRLFGADRWMRTFASVEDAIAGLPARGG